MVSGSVAGGTGPACAAGPAGDGCRARLAAAAAAVPGLDRSTHPSMVRCRPCVMASAPGATSSRMTDPAPVYAPSPTTTGATSTVSLPILTSEPTTVRCLWLLSELATT